MINGSSQIEADYFSQASQRGGPGLKTRFIPGNAILKAKPHFNCTIKVISLHKRTEWKKREDSEEVFLGHA